MYEGLRLLEVYGDVNRTAQEEVSQHRQYQALIFLFVGSLFQVNKHYGAMERVMNISFLSEEQRQQERKSSRRDAH